MSKSIKFKEGDVVVLKTRSYEEQNPRISRQLMGTLYEDTSINISFVPPYMVVVKSYEQKPKDINTQKSEEKKSEPQSQQEPSIFVKCVWYCQETNKYSERDFIEGALEKVDEQQMKIYKEKQNTKYIHKAIWIGAGILTGLLFRRSYTNK